MRERERKVLLSSNDVGFNEGFPVKGIHFLTNVISTGTQIENIFKYPLEFGEFLYPHCYKYFL